MKKVIVINLGNKGVLLSLKSGDAILDQMFLDKLNQNTIDDVDNFFGKYKTCNAYIMLDTVAQNFSYKVFPRLNYFDLVRIANRRFENEIPKTDLKYKKFLYKNAVDKKSVFLFASASMESPLKEWIEYFDTIENNLLGIFMLPLELAEFAKKLLIASGFKNYIKEQNKWIIITFNNKVSDLRQVVVYNNNLAFTRLISVEAADTEGKGGKLSDYIKEDTIRTSEYIRRFDSNFSFDRLVNITGMPEAQKEKVADLKVEEAKMLNFSPYEMAKYLKVAKTVDKDEIYLDQIIDLFILKNRKRVRFGTKKINIFFHLTILTNIIKKLFLIFFFICFVTLVIVGSVELQYTTKISSLQMELEKNKKLLQEKSKQEFGMETKEVDRIIDAGSVRDYLNSSFVDPQKSFEKFYIAKGETGLVYEVKWVINNFDYQNTSDKPNVKITYNMSLINPDGDANKIFTKYNELSTKLREVYKSDLISIGSMPNNVDFEKSYYTFPVKIEVMERK